MIEAGSLVRNWRRAPFREVGSREARSAYIPPADEIGEPRFLLAIGLRALMRAMAIVDDDARPHVAGAIENTLAALRGERSTAGPAVTRKQVSDGGRPYWVDG